MMGRNDGRRFDLAFERMHCSFRHCFEYREFCSIHTVKILVTCRALDDDCQAAKGQVNSALKFPFDPRTQEDQKEVHGLDPRKFELLTSRSRPTVRPPCQGGAAPVVAGGRYPRGL